MDSRKDTDVGTTTVISKKQTSSWRVMPIVYINIALYALCYQLQRPIEPFLVDRLLVDTANTNNDGDNNNTNTDFMMTYGKLQSFFSLLQTFGSPIIGSILDRIGTRYCFVLVFSSSALSYLILAYANSMTMLYISKIPTIFQSAFLVAQAFVATTIPTTNAADRAAALGRLTTAYTFGATIGPAIGGILGSTGDYYIGAKLAVFGSLISVILSLLLQQQQQQQQNDSKQHNKEKKEDETLPNNDTENNNNNTTSNRNSTKKSSSSSLMVAISILKNSTVWPLLSLKVVSSITNSMVHTTLPILLKQQVGFKEAELGWNMSASYVAVAIMGGIALKPLTTNFGLYRLTYLSLISKAMFVIILVFAVNVVVLQQQQQQQQQLLLLGTNNSQIIVILLSIGHACSAHVLATSLTTRTTGSVTNNEQGTLLGIEHSLFALARIFAPTIGMKLMSTGGGFLLVACVCCILDIILATLAMFFTTTTATTTSGGEKRELHKKKNG